MSKPRATATTNMPLELYERMMLEVQQKGISVNQFIIRAITAYLGLSTEKLRT